MGMKWYSKEIEDNYHLAMKLLSRILKQKYPDAKYVGVTPESFNNLFDPERRSYKIPSLEVIICIDFTNPETRENNQKIGVDLLKNLYLILMSVIIDDTIFENYKMVISDKLHINTKEYCKGLIPYV